MNKLEKIAQAMIDRKLIDPSSKQAQMDDMKTFSDEALDSMERFVMKQPIPEAPQSVFKRLPRVGSI